jgi:hypothetical protein
MLKLRNLLILNGVVLVLFALGMLLMPAALLDLFGFGSGADVKLLAQLVGVGLLANGLLSMFAIDVKEYSMRRALTLSFFIADGIGFIVALGGVLSNAMNSLGWVIVFAYLLLAAGFGYFQFLGPTE